MEIVEQIKILNEICPFYKGRTSKRAVRHDFFKNIQTEIQAYLLGFYVADGNLNHQRYTISVKLTESDREIINLYRDFISPDAYIQEVDEFTMKGRKDVEYLCKPSVRVNIASKIMTENLLQLNYGENKTYTELKLPNLSDELTRHFIRGYFDGDGSIIGRVIKPNPKNREINFRVARDFQFCGKTLTMMSEISEFLKKYDINMKVNYLKRDNMYRIHTGTKKEVENAFNLLYSDSNFYLKRKFDKFNYYVNTEVSQIIADHRNA